MQRTARPASWARWVSASAVAFVATAAGAQPQTGVVTGVVVDQASRNPLPDARVTVVGTTLAATTNGRGEYRLTNVPRGRVQVSALRLGYRAASDTVRVPAGGAATLNFGLTASLTTLSQIVVTGTVGNQERRAQGAQIASFSASDVKKEAAITTVNEMLQSRLPGV